LALTLLGLLHPHECELRIAAVSGVDSMNRVISLCGADADANAEVDFCASLFYLYSVKELQLLDRSLLHRILASRSLSLRTEDEFLSLFLDLGDDFREFLNYVEIFYLSERGISIFVDYVDFGSLTGIL
jgi:hypothetical protein